MIALLTAPDHARTRSLIATILAVAAVGFGFGLLMPLVSLRMEEMTGSAVMVSLNGAAAALSTLVATPFIPRLLHYVSGRTLMIGGFAIVAAMTAVMPLLPDPWIWIGLRFSGGLLLTCVFVVSESWINQIAPHEKRATILGIYAATLSGGFGSGAAILSLIGTEGATPFFVGAAIIAAGALPLVLLKGPGITPPERGQAGLSALLSAGRGAPTAIMAAIAFGALESILFTLTPVYGVRIGLTPETASLMVAAGALGGIALQVPLGWLADRYGRTRVLMWIAAAGVAGPGLIYLAGSSLIALYAALFFYAGMVAGLYTVGLALIGERFQGGAMIAANAAFIFGYGVGSFGGTPLAGAAMDAFNPWGLLPALSLLAALPLLVRGWRALRQQQAS